MGDAMGDNTAPPHPVSGKKNAPDGAEILTHHRRAGMCRTNLFKE